MRTKRLASSLAGTVTLMSAAGAIAMALMQPAAAVMPGMMGQGGESPLLARTCGEVGTMTLDQLQARRADVLHEQELWNNNVVGARQGTEHAWEAFQRDNGDEKKAQLEQALQHEQYVNKTHEDVERQVSVALKCIADAEARAGTSIPPQPPGSASACLSLSSPAAIEQCCRSSPAVMEECIKQLGVAVPGFVLSDIRVKRDVVPLGQLDNGISLYRYRYTWSDQIYVGVMAQEVAEIVPSAVMRGSDGYLRVNYGRLGMRLMTWDDWAASREPAAR